MTLRVRNTLLTIIIVFATTASTFFSGLYFTNSSLEKTVEQDLQFAIGIADSLVGTQMNLMKMEAVSLSARFEVAHSDGELQQLMADLFDSYPDISGFTVFDRQGTIANYSEPQHMHDLVNMHGTYIEMVYDGATIISTPFYCAERDEYVMNVYTPFQKDRILAVAISGMTFSKILEGHQIWQSGNIFMLNEEGTFIGLASQDIVSAMDNYVLDDEQVSTADQAELRDMVRTILSADSGVVTYAHEGVTRMCAFSVISNSILDWRVAVSVSLDESPQAGIMQGQIYAAAIFFVIGAVAAFFLVRLSMRPYNELEERNRHQVQMIAEIKNKDDLIQTINDVADNLLATSTNDFETVFRQCMADMATAVGADRIRVIKNISEQGVLYRTQLFEWCHESASPHDVDVAIHVSYDERLPEIKEILLAGTNINTLSRELPTIDRAWLDAQNILAFMLVPVFIRDELWGFVGFYRSQREERFSENEETAMHSGSLLLVNALLRNESVLDIQDTSDRLEVALGDAENANRAKSNFLAHMSHEMRTPLNAVMGLSELALSDDKIPAETEDKLEKIHSSGTTLLSIINDILDISKIESGKFEINPCKYDTPSMINDVITLNIVRIGEKPVIFKLLVDEGLPSVLYGDDLRVKQVFNNILSNAFKYTGAGSVEWKLSFERDESDVWLISSISDTGIGMKPEHLEHLFTDYYQVERSTNRKVEGTGLGLAITKQLVDMMQGGIEVRSTFGEGTTVSVRLRQDFISDIPIGMNVAESLMGMNYALSKRVSNTQLKRLDMSYASVLVVDDIATNLDVVRGMLKPYKLKIDCAMSGYQAVEMIRAERPRYSAVFMDHMMPGMDGVEATRIIREEIDSDYARAVPVIALTANAILGNEEMFLSKGFQAFIPKPIDIIKLDAVLREWVRDGELESGIEARSPESESALITGEPDESTSDPFDGVEIDGIDKEKALRRFSWDSTVFIDVLRSYAANTPALLDGLEQRLKACDLADYAIVVHGVKGSSYGIGADVLGRSAEVLEHTAKAGNLEAVRAEHPGFEQAARVLLQSINAALAVIDSGRERPTMMPAPAPELLRELRDACAAFDIGRVNTALAQLEACEYETGGDLVAWLKAKIDDMDFDEISGGVWPSAE